MPPPTARGAALLALLGHTIIFSLHPTQVGQRSDGAAILHNPKFLNYAPRLRLLAPTARATIMTHFLATLPKVTCSEAGLGSTLYLAVRGQYRD